MKQDYRKKTYNELEKELDTLRNSLMEEKLKLKIGAKDDKKIHIKTIKRNIARVLTIMSEKKRVDISKEVKKKEVKKKEVMKK